MTLFECKEGDILKISAVMLDKKTASRLQAMGIAQGSTVSVKSKGISGGVVVLANRSRIALGKAYSNAIKVIKQ